MLGRTPVTADPATPIIPSPHERDHQQPCQHVSQAAHAYQAAASYRSQREQEADVFRRATGALKAARDAGAIQRVQAIADNRRLWMTVADLMRDPLNHTAAGSARLDRLGRH